MKFYIEPPVIGNEIRDLYAQMIWEKHKWQHMWFLRHLEDEINKEGGMLILRGDNSIPKLEVIDFSPELVEKIESAVAKIG